MQADGSHKRRLTAAGFNVDPVWAPRGRRLAFIQWLHGWSSIYLIEADRGVQAHRIARIPSTVESLTWSPDGRWIAFGQGKSINRVRSDGGQPEQLVRRTEWIGQPAWSPTGSEIAFVSVLNGGFVWPDRYEIHALDLRTRTIREITKGEGDREPAWRP